MKTFDLAQRAASELQRFTPETRRSGAVLLVTAVITAVLAGAALFPAEAGAQAYPSKAVRIVVPFPPGGGTDALGRLVAERLMERWKQQVLVENRPGATGTIGTDVVAKSPADGYTLLIIPADITITPAVYNLPFDVRKDLTPVMALTFNNMVLSVFPTLGINSMRELLNRVKADSGKWLYGSCGNGTPHQLRHFYGTSLVEGGVNLRIVQKLMRHSSVASTQMRRSAARSAPRTGRRRAICSSDGTAAASGWLDAGPSSTISAPAAARPRAWVIARSGSR